MRRFSPRFVPLLAVALAPTALAQRSTPITPLEPGPIHGYAAPAAWSMTAKFYAETGLELDQFGASAAVAEGLAVVGAPFASQPPYFAAGRAFLFQLEVSGEWTSLVDLESEVPEQFSQFGAAVDISDGVIAIGAPSAAPACPGLLNCTSGAVTLYEREPSGSWARGQRLVPSDAQKLDRFGHSVALSGDWLAIGAWGEGDTGSVVGTGNGHGAAYLFRRVGPRTWIEQQKLKPSSLQLGDHFGASVALDGSRLVVGAPGNPGSSTIGSAYVFEEVGGTWVQSQRLFGSLSDEGDGFGNSVDIGGNLLVAGAVSDTTAYLFEQDGGLWQETEAWVETRNAFGEHVAVAKGRIAVAAPLGVPSSPSAVHVFRRDEAGAWVREQKVFVNTPNFNQFGLGMGFDGNVIVGGDSTDDGDGQDRDRGAAYSFQLDFVDTNPGCGNVLHEIQPAQLTSRDRFGRALGISGENLLGVTTNGGEVRIFERSGGAWIQSSSLAPPAGASISFGTSIAVTPGLVAVGDDGFSRMGIVNVFEELGGTWVHTGDVIGDDITPAGAFSIQDAFGNSVAVEGNTMLVGAPGNTAAYVFERSGGAWTQTQKLSSPTGNTRDRFGWAVALSGGFAAVSAMDSNEQFPWSGSVYVYRSNGVEWIPMQTLFPQFGSEMAHFGESLALDGSRLIVGVGQDDSPFLDAGSAYVFAENGGTWSLEARLQPQDPELIALFGISVALKGDTALVGARLDDTAGFNSGAAYFFHRVNGTWRQTQKTVGSDTAWDDEFGSAVALTDSLGFASAPLNDDRGDESGSVYVLADPGPVPLPELSFLPKRAHRFGPVGWNVCGGPVGGSVALYLVAIDGSPVFRQVGVVEDQLDLSGNAPLAGAYDSLGHWEVSALIPGNVKPGRLSFRAVGTDHNGAQVSSNDITLIVKD